MSNNWEKNGFFCSIIQKCILTEVQRNQKIFSFKEVESENVEMFPWKNAKMMNHTDDWWLFFCWMSHEEFELYFIDKAVNPERYIT